MTRKDFMAMAKIFRIQYHVWINAPDIRERAIGTRAIIGVIEASARAFEKINPRFNFDKFYVACGILEAKNN